ncbi:hypothetical protein LTR27_012778 [Elasticomyces elasticus]|nr:hypothetical protein LTR27_012778 [Elasticomyces elasticus]
MVSYETCRRLLSNHHILERILLHLPLRQLLLCNTLCRHARDTIQQSQQIKQALFLEPAADSTITWSATEGHWISPDGTWALPPLLNPFVPSRLHSQEYPLLRPAIGVLRITGNHTKDVPLNLECKLDVRYGGGGLTWRVRNRPVGAGISPSRLQTLVREEAPSLALMLLTQPPCSGVTLSGIAPSTGLEETLHADDGIRLGEFMARATVVAFYHSEHAEAITGHEEWRSTGRSIDEMTGWEMLQLLKVATGDVLDPSTALPPAGIVPGARAAAIPAAKVLGTYELLEMILLHLPLRQLLLCQRVGRAFKAVVDRSASIRQALFLEPSCSDILEVVIPKGRRLPVWKFLGREELKLPLLNPFAPLLKHGIYSSTFSPRMEGAGSFTIEVSLPGTTELDSTVSSTLHRFQGRFGSANGVLRWSVERIPSDGLARSEKFLDCYESVQRMLVTHPPARRLSLKRVYATPFSFGFYDAQIQPLDDKIWQQELNQTRDPTNIDGVRFADFVKTTTRIAALVSHNKSVSEINIVGGNLLRLCPKSVDKMTGWEMLRFFDVGEGRFRAEQGMDRRERVV